MNNNLNNSKNAFIRRIIFLMFAIFLFLTIPIDNCRSQWVPQSVPVSSGTFFDIKFVNANTGFIAHSTDVLLKTTNAGYNWVVNKNGRMSSLSIVDSQYFYGAGYNNLIGKLYKTTNGGITWDSLLPSNGYSFLKVHFFNRDTGLISSGNGTNNQIWMTTDGGQTKQLIQSFSGAGQGTFFFLKEKINGEYYGWMYYPGSFKLRYTTNSGLVWFTKPDFSDNFNSVFFVNQDTGWATSTSSNNYVSYTTNGGVNWLQQSLSSSVIQYDIYFANPRKGWIGKNWNNYIFATSDGGNTWGKQTVPILGAVRLFFLDSLNGWVGDGNELAYTTNGGGIITRIVNNSNSLAREYKLYQNYPNPFNASTKIKYSLKTKSFVYLKLYDITGKEILSITSKEQSEGDYEKFIDFTNRTTGIYFCRLVVKDNRLNTVFSETKRMIYLK